MSRRSKTKAMKWGLVVGIALTLGAAAPALATTHSAAIRFDQPANPPSIGTPPPADEQHEYDQSVVVTYDDRAP